MCIVFPVCQSLKTHVDQPTFWIQKFDKRGQSIELHDAWINLMQKIEKGSFLQNELVKCLMKWHGQLLRNPKSWPQESLNGITPLHISACCGVKSIVECIASYSNNPNPTKENGATPIFSAASEGHVEIIKFFARKIDNINASRNDWATPILMVSQNGH